MTNTSPQAEPSRRTSNRPHRQAFTFVGDSNLTFVNYSNVNQLRYRQEARFHNAHQRIRKRKNPAPSFVVVTTAPYPTTTSQTSETGPRLQITHHDPIDLSLAEFDLNRRTFLSTRFQLLENVWRDIFPSHFYLPNTDKTSPLIQDPQSTYLSIGRANWKNYRNIIMQPVVTSEVKRGRQNMDVVWRNQALMLQDFRALTDKFIGPGLVLSKDQFQQVFQAAFAFIIHCIAFNQEECYNAIIQVNFAIMATHENRCLRQSPPVEWIRMLLPRPPPSFNRSSAYQLELLSKIEMLLDFMSETQDKVRRSSPRVVISCGALLQIVTSNLPAIQVLEPYPNFHNICMHRILFLLHVHLNESDDQNNTFLLMLNEVAKTCLTYPAPLHITLFLWTLLNQSDLCGGCRDHREPYFHWAMRDLIAVHKLSFRDQMISWLAIRFNSITNQSFNSAPMDVESIRTDMRRYYRPEPSESRLREV